MDELAVVDTNNLVSGLLVPQGNEGRLLDLIQRQLVRVAVSPEVLAEYRLVLTRPKFRFGLEQIESVLAAFELASMVLPTRRLTVSPHEADNRFLECAESADAKFLITGIRSTSQSNTVK